MLNALMYQLRREFFKKKSNVVFTILGVAFAALMITLTGFISSESEVIRDPKIVSAGIAVIMMIAFDFTLMNMSSGDVLFTNSDVNFYLAGPFTPRFNLLLPIITCLKTSFLLMFVLSCQGALISSLMSVNALDMIILLLAVFVISVIGYSFSQIINALFYDKKLIRYSIIGVFLAVQVVWLVVSYVNLFNQAGSLVGIKELGLNAILSTLGSSTILKVVPVAGWLSLVTDGIYGGSVVKMILGIVLTIAFIAVVYIASNYFTFDYYERAIESAEKIAERVAAQKAGVDGSVTIASIKNDGKKHVGGYGASVLFHKHLNENKRISKLFFINKLAFMYKIFVIVYLAFMSRTDDFYGSAGLVMAIVMMALLDTVVFAGGRSVIEITKPTFYLIPEKTSVKLFYTVMGGVPEMLFNGLISAAILVWATGDGFAPLLAIASFVFFTVFDLLCTYVAILVGLIFKSFGKTLLMIVRYVFFWFVGGAILVSAFLFKIFMDLSIGGMFVVAAIATAIILVIIALITAKMIDNAECR